MISDKKNMQAEIAVVSVDDKLHKAIVKKFIKLITLDVVGFTILSAVLGFFAVTSGFNIIICVFFILCLIVLLYNLISLLKIILKKYTCCQVVVDKVWEAKGAYLCRITPDAYGGYKFTSEIPIKNYTSNGKDVKVGDKVIVVAGKFSRYIYLFNYEGDILVSERRTINVKECKDCETEQSKYNCYGDIREVLIDGVGIACFRRRETEEGVEYEHQEGLENSFFGPHCIIDVSGCNIPEERFDDVITCIEDTYRKSEEILKGFYDMVKVNIADGTIMTDVEIDEVYIREAFVIEEMYIRTCDELIHGRNDVEIRFYGNIELDVGKWLLKDKTLLIDINCMSGEVNYELKNF